MTAVIQPRGGMRVELGELRDFPLVSLSGFKLPRAMTLVEEIPRNAAGKAQYPKAKELTLGSVTSRAATSPAGA